MAYQNSFASAVLTALMAGGRRVACLDGICELHFGSKQPASHKTSDRTLSHRRPPLFQF